MLSVRMDIASEGLNGAQPRKPLRISVSLGYASVLAVFKRSRRRTWIESVGFTMALPVQRLTEHIYDIYRWSFCILAVRQIAVQAVCPLNRSKVEIGLNERVHLNIPMLITALDTITSITIVNPMATRSDLEDKLGTKSERLTAIQFCWLFR